MILYHYQFGSSWNVFLHVLMPGVIKSYCWLRLVNYVTKLTKGAQTREQMQRSRSHETFYSFIFVWHKLLQVVKRDYHTQREQVCHNTMQQHWEHAPSITLNVCCESYSREKFLVQSELACKKLEMKPIAAPWTLHQLTAYCKEKNILLLEEKCMLLPASSRPYCGCQPARNKLF